MKCNFVRCSSIPTKIHGFYNCARTKPVLLPFFWPAHFSSVLHAASKLCRVDLAHEVVCIAQQLPRRAEALRRPQRPAQRRVERLRRRTGHSCHPGKKAISQAKTPRPRARK